MASKRIAGITIELNGDTTGLNKALKGVDTQLKTTKTSLKDVEKLLKLDPDNVELLEQKQKLLNDAIHATTERLDTLKDALNNDLPPDQYDALQREIIATQQELDTFQDELSEAAQGEQDLGDNADDAAGDMDTLGQETSDAATETDKANTGWSVAKQVLADMVTKGIDLALAGLKKLGEAMSDAVLDSAHFADDMLTLSVQTGLSTEALQELAYMASFVDVDMDTMLSSMGKLELAMFKAQDGTGDAADALNELGVSYKLGNGELRDYEKVFWDVIGALGQVESPLEADRLANELFGKSFKDLKPLIAQGKDGINKFKKEAHEMGAVVDDEGLEALGNMNDSFDRLDQSSQALGRQLGVALSPAITALADQLIAMTQDPVWQEVFEQLGTTLENLLPTINSISELLSPIMEALSPILDIITEVLEVLSPVISTLLEPIAEIIGILLDPIAQLVDALLPALVACVDALSAVLGPVGDLLSTTIELVMPLIDSIMPLITESITGLAEEIETGLGSAITGFNQLMQGDFTGAVETWGDGLKDMWDLVSKFASKVGPVFKTMFEKLKSYTSDWGTKLVDGFTDAFDSAKQLVEDGLAAIKSFFSKLELKLPHIDLPHFSLTGSFSLNPPSVPSLSISWYAKAMQNGMILDNPTIFGAMNGRLLGGGEAGAEVVAGLGSLMGMIQNAVNNASTTNFGGVNIVINAKDQSPREIAREVDSILSEKYLRKVAVQR